MTKKISLTLCALWMACGLFCQHRESQDLLKKLIWNEKKLNIMLDTRFDLDTRITGGDVDFFSFNGQTLKIWFVGEIYPGIRYRVRHRLNRSQTPSERDNLGGATDHAWIAFDLGSRWTLTAGKQSVQLGTYEFDYNPADVYLSTMVNDDFDGYQIGLDAAYRVEGQTIHLQLVNAGSPQFADERRRDKAMAGTVLWEGSLIGGALKTRWAYSAFQHSAHRFYQWLTLGTQVNVSSFTAELDYYLGNRMIDYSSLVGLPDENRYVQDQSAALNLKYAADRWHPSLKATWNQRYDQWCDRTAYESWGVQGAVEFYPFRQEVLKDLRFHLVYSYSQTDFKNRFSSLDSVDTHTILVGLRWLFKVK
ncbi:MAG: OprO/OprP family phosphate-selective porin [Rikenellaceae bacterium]|nr:OprO/OprP family phosphate-selective porin [Rikenellaceae bacterium]